jgi:integrase/recombinase XerD
MKLIDKLKEELEGSNFTSATVKNYSISCTEYITWLQKKGKEINGETMREYCLSLKKIYATATTKLKICALRHFALHVLRKPEYVQMIPTIRQESRLPIVLSKEEVKRMIGSALNPTHKLLLTILYSCGLRLSEFLGIKISEIDFDRKNMLIHGKGQKDRFVPISDKIIEMIKNTMGDLNPRDSLCAPIRRIRGNNIQKSLSKRAIGCIINQCAKRAGINKRVHPHLLRHSLATHLIEDGVDIRYVQVLLGHANILCTAQYTHIATMPNNVMDNKVKYLFD